MAEIISAQIKILTCGFDSQAMQKIGSRYTGVMPQARLGPVRVSRV